MLPEFRVDWFKPVKEIKELEFISVIEVATDKLNQALKQFDQSNLDSVDSAARQAPTLGVGESERE